MIFIDLLLFAHQVCFSSLASVISCTLLWLAYLYLFRLARCHEESLLFDSLNVRQDDTPLDNQLQARGEHNRVNFDSNLNKLIDDIRIFKNQHQAAAQSNMKVPVLMVNSEKIENEQMSIEISRKNTALIG
jgi:hypothetical protein